MRRRVQVVFIVLGIVISTSTAQQVPEAVSRRISTEVSEVSINSVTSGRGLLTHHFDPPVTSVVVRTANATSFDQSYLLVGSDTLMLLEDSHYEGAGSSSAPVIFNEPIASVTFFLPETEGPVTVFGITAPPLSPASLRQQQAAPEGCEEPLLVDQEEWRDGLPAPSYSRSFTETEHLIVHHSATSNSLTDYYNVVRNIYLYHTQVNGWSDIGYNYLVAPDGTIFKGRDPAAGEQDLVLGAHFCGRNSTTMGVCVLGNYAELEPSSESLLALEQLLTWKAFKDELDVLSEKNHPLNPALPVIAGHRQGCATECPGDELFEKLDELRANVAANLIGCNDPLVSDVLVLYPNPSLEDVRIEVPEGEEIDHLSVISMGGQLQQVSFRNEGQNGYEVRLSHLKPGVYIIRIKLKSMDPQFKKVVLL